MVGIDISDDALALARDNGLSTGHRVDWRHGDLVAPLTTESVDLVVSNPPYLTAAEYDSLDRSVRDWEPEGALRSGDDGLAATRRLVVEARRVMAHDGWLVFEADARRADLAARLAREAGWDEVTVHDDLFGRPRVVAARRGSW